MFTGTTTSGSAVGRSGHATTECIHCCRNFFDTFVCCLMHSEKRLPYVWNSKHLQIKIMLVVIN